MATVTSTIKMMDAMTGPLKKITTGMNIMINTMNEMQQTVDRNVKVDKQLLAAQKQISSAEAEINRQIERATNEQKRFNRAVQSGENQADGLLRSIRNIAAAYLTYQGAQSVMRISDDYINTLARINLINDGLQTTEEIQNRIFTAADRARGSYSEMAASIGKMGILASDAFSGVNEIIAFTELMQKSFRVGGASTMEQQAGMYQLTQAMAAGRLQGDEFRSIMENAPMLAQAIADFAGKSKSELKTMSAEGTITADIIKGAVFSAADEINQRFEQMPVTFSDVANKIKNSALKVFGPAIQRINVMLNDPQTEQNIDRLGQAFVAASVFAIGLLNVSSSIYNFFSNNWPVIEPIIWGIVGAYGAWFVLTKGQAAAQGLLAMRTAVMTAAITGNVFATQGLAAAWAHLNAVQRANIFLFLIGAIIALIVWLYHLWKTNDDFAVGLFRTWNSILNFFDRVPGYFWRLVEWMLTPFEWWAESTGKIYDTVINGIIAGINEVLDIVNKITGSSYEIATEFSFENIAKGMKEYARIQKEASFESAAEKAAEREQRVLDFLENRAAKRAKEQSERETQIGFDFNKWSEIPTIDTVNEVGKIRDTVDISSEDLKTMRELAEMRNIQNFVTLTPTVNVQTGDINNGYGLDTVIKRIEESLTEEIAASAQGVYGND